MVRLNPRSLRVLNQDGASDTMRSVEGADHVGAFLREAREAAGRSVADVVQNLRIRRVYLEAIEDGRFDELPGAAYAVGFVRSYATYLHLDAPTLVERFKEEATGIQSPQELEFPTPVPEGRFPGGLLVTLCLLLAAAAFGAWYWYQNQNSIEVARVPAPPGDTGTAATTAPVGPGSPSVGTSPAEPAAAEAEVRPPETGSAPSVETSPVETPAVEMATVETTTETTMTETSEAESNLPEPAGDAGEADVPLVPPSYLEPQTDPLASMAETPDLPAASDAPAETPAPDVTMETPAAAPPVEPATPDPVVAAAPDTAQPPADAPAAAPETSEVSEAPEVAAASPAPPAFSSEPAIVALPETVMANDPPTVANTAREGRVFGARNATARIILSARENTWVQVRDADENVVLTQMLQAGDSYRVPNRDGLRLMTGNAGGLEIQVDGDAVPAIGDRGESRRDVRLDPNRLKAGTAVIR